MEVRPTTCCGLRELNGIIEYTTPEAILEHAVPQFRGTDGAFMMFSCPTSNSIGRKLAEFIKDNEFGVVTESPVRRNPNSGNMLRVFMWALNKKPLYKWVDDRAKKRGDVVFEVGQRVRGRVSANIYGITKEGWEGVVVAILSNGHEIEVVGGTSSRRGPFRVLSAHFDLIV